MKRRILLSTLLVAAVTVSAAAYYRTSTAATVPQYALATVTRGDVVDAIEATGTLQTVETVEVSTQVSGTIKSLHADFNSRVTAGQIIARLEPSLFQAQVDQAQASLLRLEADADRARVATEDSALKLARARELWAQQLIPKNDLETADANSRQAAAALKAAEAQVVQARASLNQMQVNLGHTIIRAPITGIVISRNVDVGQTVAASTSAPTLFVIAKDLAHMQVSASIDESDIGRVEPGQQVRFTVDAYPRQAFHGRVSQVRLQPVVESNVVSYVTIIDVANPDLMLKPGMTANVAIDVSRADDVLRVPTSALRFRPAGDEPAAAASNEAPRIWVLRDGRPQPVAVTPGLSDGALTAIDSSRIAEGESVITGAAQAGTAASAASSPLLPFGGRRPGAGASGGRGGAR